LERCVVQTISQNGGTDLDLSSSEMLFCFRHWTPFLFQNAILTFLLHIRGLHLGFALLGTMWLLVTMVELLCNGMWSHPCLNAAPWLCMLTILVTVVCVTTYPAICKRHHNCFEWIHCFAGWTALRLLWVFISVADAWEFITIFMPAISREDLTSISWLL